MLPFPITSLEQTYLAFKAYYIAKHGSNKFETIFEKISYSERIKQISSLSIRDRKAPTIRDFLNEVVSIPYFIISKNETKAIAILIALNQWNEVVNKEYKLANNIELERKVQSIFEQLGIN
jgi:hypothetical protein